MDHKYQPPLRYPAGPPPSAAQRPRNQSKKRSAQQLGVDSMGRNVRPYMGSNDNDAIQAQYLSNRHEYNYSNDAYAPADVDMSYSLQTSNDVETPRETLQADDMFDAGNMQHNGYPWFNPTKSFGNTVSNAEDLDTEQGQDMKGLFEEESDSDNTPDIRNDASGLFVSNDDEPELSEDEEIEEQIPPDNPKNSVHFASEYSRGLGTSFLKGNRKQPTQTTQTTTPHRQQALPMPGSSYHDQDFKPIIDSPGSMGSVGNAQQQYGHYPAPQIFQRQQRMTQHSSMNQQFSSRPAPATQSTVQDRPRDPRLVGREGHFPSHADTSRRTLAPQVADPTAFRGSEPTPTPRSNQDPRTRMSATPSARRTPKPVTQVRPAQIKRSVQPSLASSNTRSTAPDVRGPTPCRYADAAFLKAATGQRVSQNNVPPRQPPITRHTPVPEPGWRLQDLGFSDVDVLKFEPDNTDKQVYQWRKAGFDWDNIMSLLHLQDQKCSRQEVQVRQKLMDFKRSMIQNQDYAADLIDASTAGAQQAELDHKPVTTEELVPKAPAASVRLQAHGSLSLAAIREKDKLAWQQERKDLEQGQRKTEEELTAERLRSKQLGEEVERERLRSQGKAKLEHELTKKNDQAAKDKEKIQNLEAKLKDEKMLRNKAEKELRDEKKKEHNRTLALAATSRQPGRAQGGGFKFINDEVPDEGRTPTRSRSRKRAQAEAQVEVDENGHAIRGGKTISQKLYQQWMKHLQNGSDDEIQYTDQEMPEQISSENLTYFIYSVRRKQWLKDEDEPESEGIVCGQYIYLHEANKAAQEELFRPLGNDGIVIEPYQDYTIHGDRDRDTGVCWTTLEVPTGFVKVWVDREVHTPFKGPFPQFEPNGMLSKSVFVVMQEIDDEVEEMEEIFTTSDFANNKASDKAFELVWFGNSMNIDYVNRKSVAQKLKAEKLEDLEDTKQCFFEEFENKDGKMVKIWVVKRQLVGPRNM